MKPWKICINKKNSYKLDVRGLINTDNIKSKLNNEHLNYDFINKKNLKNDFKCRFEDKK
jgi:hypothetical protein